MSPLVPGQADRFSPVELKLWTAVILEGRGRPAVLRWPCCRAALFANVLGCLCRHRSSRACVKGLHWKKKNALSLQVQFLFWQIHLNLVMTSFIIISRALMAAEHGIGGSSAVCHRIVPSAAPGGDGKSWALQDRVRVLFASWGEILFVPKWYFCCCQNGDAKVGWFGYWEIPAVIRWVLASLWVSGFFTEMNLQLLCCCLCQRQSDVFLTVVFS